MRRKKTKQGRGKEPGLKEMMMRSTSRVGWLFAVAVVTACTLGLVARAYSRRSVPPITRVFTPPLPVSSEAPQSEPSWITYYSRLSAEPTADRMRSVLGNRFSSPAKQISYISGILLLNSQPHPIRMVRSQEEEGEIVDLSLDNGAALLTWNQRDGATSTSGALSGDLKRVVERIVLNGPDQFILAQLRGAGYYTVATDVVPEEALNTGNYRGAAWDAVRVQEPDSADGRAPESRWRMYYINTGSGLIERIISGEQGDPVMAELLDWTKRDGDLVPGRIRWSRNKQVFMELAISGVTFGSK
jgi:hypothetical protein